MTAHERCVGDAEHRMKLPGRDLERTRRRSCPGRRLRECGRSRSVEGDAPFHFLGDLVDVPVEHRHRTEPREQLQRLGGIVGAPAPLGIDGPQRDVGEDDDRR